MSLYCTRSLYKLVWQDLCKRPLGKISVQDLYKKSQYEISANALYKRLPCQNLCARSPWRSKWAPRHSESDLTDPTWREDGASNVKMKTAPQQERSIRHKVPRELHEQCQNSKYTTARAIWQAQSEERVARGISNLKQRKRSDANETTTGVHGRPRNSHRATTRAAWATHATRGSGVAHVINFHKTLRPPRRINIEKVAFFSKLENWKGSSLVWNKKISVKSCWFP